MRAMNIAATGMLAQQLNVEVISNNLANLTTTAYKRQRAEFKDLLYQTEQRVGSQGAEDGTVIPAGIQIGLGVKTGAVYRINEQGNMQETKNPLDIAIQGNGFFQVQLPNGEIGFTRAGAFQKSPEGEIVTQEGYPLATSITIPDNAREISVTSTGKVQVTIDGQVDPQDVGTIELASFINVNGLEARGDSIYIETAASGQPLTGVPGDPGFGTVLNRYLEASNVDSVKEITNLIVAQRSYEMNSKVISAADEMMRTASQLRN